ncbi:MAG: DSD1 family PLP-dependent enzyme [Firmicutes bacterium]|nr:DSD1 family PLP-dependent enzyme [Bacillota bacterium]
MEDNIEQMARYFASRKAKLRPHAKTHKSPFLAWKQLEAGAIGITCAKLSEAEVLIQGGIQDILLANQVTHPSKIRRLTGLARHSRIIVACDSLENARDLAEAAQAAGASLNVLIEVDVGLGRSGLRTTDDVIELARYIQGSPSLKFKGIMGYEGHCVFIKDFAARKAEGEKSNARLVAVRDALIQAGIPVDIVSAGGTGTYNIAGDFPGITEVQAGSYLFMDSRYLELDLGFKSALTVLATVVSRPEPHIAVLDAGKKAITEEFGLPQVVNLPGAELTRLSEEHGVLKLAPEAQGLRVNDQVQLIPSHGCTTIDLHDWYYGIRKGDPEITWPVAARGRFI